MSVRGTAVIGSGRASVRRLKELRAYLAEPEARFTHTGSAHRSQLREVVSYLVEERAEVRRLKRELAEQVKLRRGDRRRIAELEGELDEARESVLDTREGLGSKSPRDFARERTRLAPDGVGFVEADDWCRGGCSRGGDGPSCGKRGCQG